MIPVVLGILDIVAGFLTLLSNDVVVGVFLFFGWFMLIKGLFSLISSMGQGYFLDWMGWIDLLTGITLLTAWNVPYIWVFCVLKGAYSTMFGLLS